MQAKGYLLTRGLRSQRSAERAERRPDEPLRASAPEDRTSYTPRAARRSCVSCGESSARQESSRRGTRPTVTRASAAACGVAAEARENRTGGEQTLRRPIVGTGIPGQFRPGFPDGSRPLEEEGALELVGRRAVIHRVEGASASPLPEETSRAQQALSRISILTPDAYERRSPTATALCVNRPKTYHGQRTRHAKRPPSARRTALRHRRRAHREDRTRRGTGWKRLRDHTRAVIRTFVPDSAARAGGGTFGRRGKSLGGWRCFGCSRASSSRQEPEYPRRIEGSKRDAVPAAGDIGIARLVRPDEKHERQTHCESHLPRDDTRSASATLARGRSTSRLRGYWRARIDEAPRLHDARAGDNGHFEELARLIGRRARSGRRSNRHSGDREPDPPGR